MVICLKTITPTTNSHVLTDKFRLNSFFVLSDEPRQNQWRELVDRKLVKAHPPSPPRPAVLLLAVPRRLFCFDSLVGLDVVFRYLSLFLSYINIKIGRNRCLMLDCMGNSCSPGCRWWCV